MDPIDREQVEDVYDSEDFPVLLGLAKIELADGPTVMLSHDLARRLTRPEDAVRRSLARLQRGGLVEGEDKPSLDGGFFLARGLTAEGLREVGAWRRAQGLRKVLEEEAGRLEASQPDKAGKLRVILDEFEDVGTTITAKVVAEMIKWMATGH
jgi:hypothetical protein